MGDNYRGGRNIALKLPTAAFEPTVAFYRDVLRLAPWEGGDTSFVFGSNRLWLDHCPHLAAAEVWLEIVAEDVDEAASELLAAGVERCDEVEPLPEGFRGFWIRSPAGLVNLVCAPGESG